MPVIAITGMFCGGKTTVLSMLKKKGARVFNIDTRVHAYYKDRTQEVYLKVRRRFPEVLTRQHAISRSKLRATVLKNKRNLRILERIVHPYVIKDLTRWSKESKKKSGVYVAEVPLLFQKGLGHLFQKIIVVRASKLIVVRRIAKRFHVSPREARRLGALFYSQKMRKGDDTYLVINNGSRGALKKRVDSLWKEITHKKYSFMH